MKIGKHIELTSDDALFGAIIVMVVCVTLLGAHCHSTTVELEKMYVEEGYDKIYIQGTTRYDFRKPKTPVPENDQH